VVETEYTVHVQNRARMVRMSSFSSKTRIDRVPAQDGFKYCFEVPTSYLFLRRNGKIFATGNTGKTRSVLEGFKQLRANRGYRRMLVLGPLSILKPAWANDIERWTPDLSWGISTSGSNKRRLNAFESGADIVITNHDAVKWLVKNKHLLADFDVIAIDESTAFKHRTSDRSKAARELVKLFDFRILMTGTPNSNGVCDVWHQAMLLDGGERLGRMFSGFRSQVCAPVQVGPDPRMVKWIDKEGAEDIVAERLRDITVRFKFEDCIDIPPNVHHMMHVDLPEKLMRQYRQLEREAMLALEDATINAIHAGAKAQKLLQLCSGAVYDEDHVAQLFSTDRYELVMELVHARQHSVVVFNWRHQREQLVALAEKSGIAYSVIDGNTPVDARTKAVDAFQAGELRVLFVHPQSAGHGLTLTRGSATIWASPTYNAEWFQQVNARIYRAGQTEATETIMIAANDTKETEVYEALQGKRERMFNLLSVFANTTGGA
jgi:SNF2 family DNA or RNA helicase